jgi:hypothetical protein
MGHLKSLLSDGTTSPLFRKDAEAAKRAAAEIRKELSAA